MVMLRQIISLLAVDVRINCSLISKQLFFYFDYDNLFDLVNFIHVLFYLSIFLSLLLLYWIQLTKGKLQVYHPSSREEHWLPSLR